MMNIQTTSDVLSQIGYARALKVIGLKTEDERRNFTHMAPAPGSFKAPDFDSDDFAEMQKATEANVQSLNDLQEDILSDRTRARADGTAPCHPQLEALLEAYQQLPEEEKKDPGVKRVLDLLCHHVMEFRAIQAHDMESYHVVGFRNSPEAELYCREGLKQWISPMQQELLTDAFPFEKSSGALASLKEIRNQLVNRLGMDGAEAEPKALQIRQEIAFRRSKFALEDSDIAPFLPEAMGMQPDAFEIFLRQVTDQLERNATTTHGGIKLEDLPKILEQGLGDLPKESAVSTLLATRLSLKSEGRMTREDKVDPLAQKIRARQLVETSQKVVEALQNGADPVDALFPATNPINDRWSYDWHWQSQADAQRRLESTEQQKNQEKQMQRFQLGTVITLSILLNGLLIFQHDKDQSTIWRLQTTDPKTGKLRPEIKHRIDSMRKVYLKEHPEFAKEHPELLPPDSLTMEDAAKSRDQYLKAPVTARDSSFTKVQELQMNQAANTPNQMQ